MGKPSAVAKGLWRGVALRSAPFAATWQGYRWLWGFHAGRVTRARATPGPREDRVSRASDVVPEALEFDALTAQRANVVVTSGP